MSFFTRPNRHKENVLEMYKNDNIWDKAHPIRTFLRETWYEIWYRIPRRIFEDFPAEVKRFYQRGKYGIADCDIWGLDYYLAEVILRGLRKIRKTHMGFPSTFTYDEQGKEKANWDTGSKEWDKVLDKMIYAFQLAQDVLNYYLIYMSYSKWDEDYYKKSKKLVKQWNKELDKDMPKRVMTKLMAKKYEEGFDLFGKHFLDLWD